MQVAHFHRPETVFGDQRRTPLTPRHEQDHVKATAREPVTSEKFPRSRDPGNFLCGQASRPAETQPMVDGNRPETQNGSQSWELFRRGRGREAQAHEGARQAGQPGRKPFAKCRGCEYSEFLLVAPLIMTRLVSSFDGAWWAAALLWCAEAEEADEAEQGGPGLC